MTDPLLPKLPLQGPPQLTNCDREAIHIPGAIQSHGGLIAVSVDTQIVQFASANIAEFTRLQPEQLLGKALSSVLPALVSICEQLAHRTDGSRISQKVVLDRESYAVSAHLCDGYHLLELETADDSDGNSDQLIQKLFGRLAGLDLQSAYDAVVQEVRSHANFDRVMLYEFLEDGHGVVVAESAAESLEPFLGLHYPSTDIPAPARRLYELNWIRQICDVSSAPVDLISNSVESAPLNLTYAHLRAISPIHIEYLKNMQVKSSMSISIMNGGQLWGLIACHHGSPKFISGPMRDSCELAGSVLSAYLTSRQQQDYLRRQLWISDSIAEQLSLISNFDDVESGLERAAPAFCQMLESDGMVWQSGDEQFCWGEVPNQLAISQIITALDARSKEALTYTDHMGAWLQSSKSFGDRCAGLLAIRLGQMQGGLLIFFRGPFRQTITWAGDPNKTATNENGRLSPRKSFAAWQETVEGKSRPWTQTNLETARSLSNGLQTMVVEQSMRLRRANEELHRLNTDLDAFAYAASHDLKEPLRGLHHYVYLLENSVANQDQQFSTSIAGLKRILNRMSDLLDGLLRFSRAGRSELQIESFSLSEVVDQALDILFAGRFPENVQVEIDNDEQIEADFSCLREVLVNLISNGIKYNESPAKVIHIGTEPLAKTPIRRRAGEQNYAIYVRDNGIGISPEHLNQVFDIFIRLHDREAYGGGSGAGLTIVRRLVERHGGTVVAKSDTNGTTFYFSLGDNA